ncbi:MAG: GNAT family N-acetyltransferase [Balneolaceae bacterium]
MSHKGTIENKRSSSGSSSSRAAYSAKPVLRVITGESEFSALKNEWEDLVDKSDTTVFQTYQWNHTWWKHFCHDKELHIITIYSDQLLIGIIPLFVDTIEILQHRIYSCLRLLGSTVSQPAGENLKGLKPYSDYLDVIVRPGYEETVIQPVLEHLVDKIPDYDETILDEVSENSLVISHLLPALKKENMPYYAEDSSVCPIVELDETWDAYLDSLSKRSRFHARKFIKRAYKPGYKVFDLVQAKDPDELLNSYNYLVELHQKRWNDSGQPGVFAEKRYYDFLKEIIVHFSARGWLQLQVAKAVEEEGSPVAVDLLFKFNRRLYLVQRAYDVHSESNTYGPGNVLLYDAIRKGIEEGFNVFDFLRGDEAFKFRTAEEVINNRRITISSLRYTSQIKNKSVKKFTAVRRRFTLETDKFKLMFDGKSFAGGLSTYLQFMYKRITGC